ncbi:clusterin-associated protein (macronuclear) [Tetrahymena thermophila SB210]|uniref:Clusterin-associated protein n=1 Tax=Tetrahymena thermophila (strain SB210) TaxID=312017 RepID=Q228X0_TETTS|nr:clusterin-associated protein [Tetrahymena thermophila SB210]EAR81839.1 clusterin-associated protein [Tetrahymena thermophila SB210]|eukprot:XP_001029502.1 clusterin-associated protein [Tetrahymena thermophila SB210]
MSYRELRNFCEMMRALGYSRLISMENFRKPNFELVADILYWLATRVDPQADIPEQIDEERHRVEFIKAIATLFASKIRIKLNTRKLYQADGHAVQEIIKVATVLYKAYNSSPGDEEENAGFTLPSKLSNIKAHRAIANDITEIAQKLFDSLNKENDLQQHRDKALQFLDNISRNLESNSEQAYIEQCVREIIKQQDQGIIDMQNYVSNLEKEQKNIEDKTKKLTIELQKQQTLLYNLKVMKPAYMEEYIRLEYELEKLYQIYIEKFRNLDYLENELDQYNLIEKKKQDEKNRRLEINKAKSTAAYTKKLIGDDLDDSILDGAGNAGGKKGERKVDSRDGNSKGNSNASRGREQMKFGGKGMQNAVEEEEESIEGDDGEGESEGDLEEDSQGGDGEGSDDDNF